MDFRSWMPCIMSSGPWSDTYICRGSAHTACNKSCPMKFNDTRWNHTGYIIWEKGRECSQSVQLLLSHYISMYDYGSKRACPSPKRNWNCCSWSIAVSMLWLLCEKKTQIHLTVKQLNHPVATTSNSRRPPCTLSFCAPQLDVLLHVATGSRPDSFLESRDSEDCHGQYISL